MNIMLKYLTLLLSIVVLSGCKTMPPSPEVMAKADYGAYPTTYRSIISSYMELILKDASSAKYRYIKEPSKSWSDNLFGYSVCVHLNARNSFGGYTGFKLHYFMIKNNRVINHFTQKAQRAGTVTYNMCKKTGSL